MTKLLSLLFGLLVSLAFVFPANAQDAIFSQYYSSSLYLSPCFAGVVPNINVGVNTRTQWKSITAPYVTQQISLIKPFYKSGLTDHNWGGAGISIYQDKAGDFGYKSLGVNLSGAYNIKLSRTNTVTLGLMMGLIQKQIDFNQLEWGNQADLSKATGFNPGLPPDGIQSSNTLQEKKSLIDFGAGALYYFNKRRDKREKGLSFWTGYSAFHLNQPNESMVSGYKQKLQMLSKGLLGVEFTVGSRFNLSPNVLLARQGKELKDLAGLNNLQINTGLYITYMFIEQESDLIPKDIIIGGWYRFGDSYIAMVGFESNTYTIGFSYDLNQSQLKSYSNGKGAWEVSLKIEIPRKEKVKRYHSPRI